MPAFVAAALTASLALQVQVDVQRKPVPTDTTKKGTSIEISVGNRRARDTITVVRDSTDSLAFSGRGRRRSVARRLPVTADALRTAYKDANAKKMLEHARVARLQQDSALVAYDATAYSRISAGMGFAKIGRDRLIFRTERAARVRWQRDVGAWIDLKGARTAIPIAPQEAQREAQRDMLDEGDMTPVPYYPGYESLWIGGGVARSQVDEREIVHPIATGAEAYYTYETGDSITFKLPDAKFVRLRELRVRPRTPKWNVVVGSLWFDESSGQLVRAAYRFATPLDIWAMVKEEDPHAMDDVPFWVKPLISPMHGQITAVALEFGLYEGRFWLPRIQAAEGSAQVSFMRVPFKMEQSFKYASVNARDSLPPIVVASNNRRPRLDTLPDSLADKLRDSIRAARRARRDSIRDGLITEVRSRQCDTSNYRVFTESRRDDIGPQLKIGYRVPCDLSQLEHSPDLPPSIFDPGDEIFGSKERDALISEALSLGAQPPFLLMGGHLPPYNFKYGVEFMRYNRVEGLSLGAQLEQPLGAGYNTRLTGRLGTADLEPNGELTFERTNLTTTIGVTGYNRLMVSNDWGNPLSFGSSVSALLFGRDEGFYYRSTGVELFGTREPRSIGGHLSWRLFYERQRTAKQETNFSLGPAFVPNITSLEAAFAGAGLRFSHTAGLNPRGWRLLSDIRLEGAAAVEQGRDSAATNRYGRGAADFTLSHGLPFTTIGAITVSGGSSVGDLTPQRLWYLGGARSVRGQRPDTAMSGNAYWLTRAELGYDYGGVRPMIYGDLGWVGSRDSLYTKQLGRPMSGVGVGTSFMDGLFRFDVTRGLYPQKRWRVDFYLEAPF